MSEAMALYRAYFLLLVPEGIFIANSKEVKSLLLFEILNMEKVEMFLLLGVVVFALICFI